MRKMFEKGFTLAEMLVVIFIIGAILGIGIPIVSNIMNDSNTEEFVTNAKLLEDSVSMYYRDYGVMPISESGDISSEITDVSKEIIKSKLLEAGVINASTVTEKLVSGGHVKYLKFDDVKEYTPLTKEANGIDVFIVIDMVEDLSDFGTYENDIAGFIFSTENRDKSSGIVYSGAHSIVKEKINKNKICKDKEGKEYPCSDLDKEEGDLDDESAKNQNKDMYPYGFRTKSSEDLKNGKANLTVTWTDRFVDKNNDLTTLKGFTGGKYVIDYIVCDIKTSDIDCLNKLNAGGDDVITTNVGDDSKVGSTYTQEFTNIKYGKVMMKLKAHEIIYGGNVISGKKSKAVLLDAPSNFDAENPGGGNGKTPDGQSCRLGVDENCYQVGIDGEGKECLIGYDEECYSIGMGPDGESCALGKDTDCYPIGTTPDGENCALGLDSNCFPIGLDDDGDICAVGHDDDCFVIGVGPDGEQCRLGKDANCYPLGEDGGKTPDGQACTIGVDEDCYPIGKDTEGNECLIGLDEDCFVLGIGPGPNGELCRLGYDEDCYVIGVDTEGEKCALGKDPNCYPIGYKPPPGGKPELCGIGLVKECVPPFDGGGGGPGNPIPPGKIPGDGDSPDNPEIKVPVKKPGEGLDEVIDSDPKPEDFYKTYKSYEKNKVSVTSEFNGLRIKGVSVGDYIVLKEVKKVGDSYEFDKNRFVLFSVNSENVLIPKNPYLQKDFQTNASSTYKYVLEFYKNQYIETEVPSGYVPDSAVLVEYK